MIRPENNLGMYTSARSVVTPRTMTLQHPLISLTEDGDTSIQSRSRRSLMKANLPNHGHVGVMQIRRRRRLPCKGRPGRLPWPRGGAILPIAHRCLTVCHPTRMPMAIAQRTGRLGRTTQRAQARACLPPLRGGTGVKSYRTQKTVKRTEENESKSSRPILRDLSY